MPKDWTEDDDVLGDGDYLDDPKPSENPDEDDGVKEAADHFDHPTDPIKIPPAQTDLSRANEVPFFKLSHEFQSEPLERPDGAGEEFAIPGADQKRRPPDEGDDRPDMFPPEDTLDNIVGDTNVLMEAISVPAVNELTSDGKNPPLTIEYAEGSTDTSSPTLKREPEVSRQSAGTQPDKPAPADVQAGSDRSEAATATLKATRGEQSGQEIAFAGKDYKASQEALLAKAGGHLSNLDAAKERMKEAEAGPQTPSETAGVVTTQRSQAPDQSAGRTHGRQGLNQEGAARPPDQQVGAGAGEDLAKAIEELNAKADQIITNLEIIVNEGVVWRFE